jgi:hypothetical protein
LDLLIEKLLLLFAILYDEDKIVRANTASVPASAKILPMPWRSLSSP